MESKPKGDGMSDRKTIGDGDYILRDGAAWFTVGGFSVRLAKTDEGVVCDVYAEGVEDGDPIASCYAFDSEVEEAKEEARRIGQ